MAAHLSSLQEGQEIGPYGCIFVHRAVSLDKHPRAWFICPYCGNGFLTRIDVVKSGGARSCGCYQRSLAKKQLRINIENLSEEQKQNRLRQITELGKNSYINLTGRKFGNLTALSKTAKRAADRSVIWKCICCCSNIANCPAVVDEDRVFYASSTDLLSGHTTKSSLCHCSSGEKALMDFFQQQHIRYIFQYRDKRCINSETGYVLPFDFFLPEHNILIEYDGRQHEFTEPHGFYDEKYLEGMKKRDNIKTLWVKNFGFILIRIRQKDHQSSGNLLFEQKILPFIEK